MSRSSSFYPTTPASQFSTPSPARKKSIRIKMFIFSDPSLLQAVIDAHKRGVDVRVMLNPARRDGKEENADSPQSPHRSAASRSSTAIPRSTSRTRSPWSSTTRPPLSSRSTGRPKTSPPPATTLSSPRTSTRSKRSRNASTPTGTATKFDAGDQSHLIWCIGNGRQRLGQLIDSAKHSLWLQNERYQDPTIIEHLIRAHSRGVKIHIMARPPHKLKKEKLIEGVSGLRSLQDIGVKIHKLKHIKLHAKLLLADDARAIIGSINLAPGSFDSRRELAIEVDDPNTSSAASARLSTKTGQTPTRWISPTKACSPNSKDTTRT